MKIHRIAQTLVVAATLSIAAPGFAQDQTTQQGPMGQGMMGGQSMGFMHGMGGQMNMIMGGGCPMMSMGGQDGTGNTYIEGRLAFLKAELDIKKSQSKSWDAFADAMRANVQGMADMHNTMMGQMGKGMPSVTERLDTHIAMMEARLEALKKLKPATDALYKELSSKQREKADQLMLGVGCMM